MESNHGVLRLPCPCPRHYRDYVLVVNQFDVPAFAGWYAKDKPDIDEPLAEVTQRRFFRERGLTFGLGEVYYWREDA